MGLLLLLPLPLVLVNIERVERVELCKAGLLCCRRHGLRGTACSPLPARCL